MKFSKKFLMITLSLTALTLIFQWILSSVPGFLVWLFELILLASLVAFLRSLFSLGKNKWKESFVRSFLLIGSVTGVLILLMAIFVSYANTFPGKLASVTLENGSGKIITFYQMSHIGTEPYYQEIRSGIESLAQRGVLIYIEWVKPGKSENKDIMDRTLGVRLSSGTYGQIADILDMRAQDDSLYAGISTGSLRYPDISIDELVTLIGTGSMKESPPLDLERMLSGEIMNPLARRIIGETLRAVMNTSIKSDLSSEMLMEVFPPPVRQAILDARNQSLVSLYQREKPERAIFLYGALHFHGVYALLRKDDPSWQIKNIKPLYPYVR
jgi:hypothetical protein